MVDLVGLHNEPSPWGRGTGLPVDEVRLSLFTEVLWLI